MPRVVEVTHSYGNLAKSKPGYLAERKPGYCYVSNVLMSGPPCCVNFGNEVSCFNYRESESNIIMAKGGNILKLGGYDNEFTSNVPEYWKCLICHLTLKDPVQIVGCGHRLCSICMESLLR